MSDDDGGENERTPTPRRSSLGIGGDRDAEMDIDFNFKSDGAAADGDSTSNSFCCRFGSFGAVRGVETETVFVSDIETISDVVVCSLISMTV